MLLCVALHSIPWQHFVVAIVICPGLTSSYRNGTYGLGQSRDYIIVKLLQFYYETRKITLLSDIINKAVFGLKFSNNQKDEFCINETFMIVTQFYSTRLTLILTSLKN